MTKVGAVPSAFEGTRNKPVLPPVPAELDVYGSQKLLTAPVPPLELVEPPLDELELLEEDPEELEELDELEPELELVDPLEPPDDDELVEPPVPLELEEEEEPLLEVELPLLVEPDELEEPDDDDELPDDELPDELAVAPELEDTPVAGVPVESLPPHAASTDAISDRKISRTRLAGASRAMDLIDIDAPSKSLANLQAPSGRSLRGNWFELRVAPANYRLHTDSGADRKIHEPF